MIDIEALKKQILLQGLTDEDYEMLAPGLERRSYGKGALVFKEGDPPEGIFLIHKGRVRISTSLPAGPPKTLIIFKEGNYFGDLSALENRAHSARATTLTQTTLFLLVMGSLDNGNMDTLALSCKILKKLALIAGKNIRHMNDKYLRLGEAF
jgi:CRP/FNR family transcriptional regulator